MKNLAWRMFWMWTFGFYAYLGTIELVNAANDPSNPRDTRWLFNRDFKAFASERSEWAECYEALTRQDVATAEKALQRFFDRVMDGKDPAYSGFSLGYAYAPAEMVTRLLPRDSAKGLLERLIARYPSINALPLRHSLQFAIGEMAYAHEDFDMLLVELTPPKFVPATTQRPEIEEAIIGLSSKLIKEGRTNLAVQLCASHFGDLSKPKLTFATNWYHFMHFVNLQDFVGNSKQKITMIEEWRRQNPIEYGIGHQSVTGVLFKEYRKVDAPLAVAKVVAEDLNAIGSGRLKVSVEDQKYLEDYVEALKEQQYLDKDLNPQVPPQLPPQSPNQPVSTDVLLRTI